MQREGLQELKQSEKAEVANYFNGTGFDRWNRIYSESEDINKVQRNIRIGHQKTVDDVLSWLKESGDLSEMSFCDAGCGVGSLSLPLVSLSLPFGVWNPQPLFNLLLPPRMRRCHIYIYMYIYVFK